MNTIIAGFALVSLLSVADGPVASIQTSDGRRHVGQVVGDAKSGFRFVAEKGGPTLPLDQAGTVSFESTSTSVSSSSAPFQICVGHQQWVSGRLIAVNDKDVRLDSGPAASNVVAARAGVLSVRQRPGEAIVVGDTFDSLDEVRWTKRGDVSIDPNGPREGTKCLRLSSERASVEHRLATPIAAGRLVVAFHNAGRLVPGRKWAVELHFSSGSGTTSTVRVVPGWTDEVPTVETSQGQPPAVQRLRPGPGWHTLTARFDSNQIDLAIDTDSLSHGKGPSGPLVALRMVTEIKGDESAPADIAARFADLKLTRSIQPFRSFEVDPTQDEARLVSGDQLFGKVLGADGNAVVLEMLGQKVRCEWPEVMSLHFHRRSTAASLLTGQQVRVEWLNGPTRDLDAIEGALQAVSDRVLNIQTPFAGTIAVPIADLKRLVPLGRSARLVVDPFPHHLGDQYMPKVDPPQPEGGVLERKFMLESVPAGTAAVVADVIEVAGEDEKLAFAEFIKNGELRTNVFVNGRQIDYLNRHVRDQNESPARVRMPIPTGLLRPGENTLRFQQVGKMNEPEYLDDMGLLGLAIEFSLGGPMP